MKLMKHKILLLIFTIIFFLSLPVEAKEKLTQQKIDNIKAILELSNYKETVRVTWENMFQQIIKVQQAEGRAALLREVELVVAHAARTVSMKCRWLLFWGVARQCGAMLLRGSAARGVRGLVRWFPCPQPQ